MIKIKGYAEAAFVRKKINDIKAARASLAVNSSGYTPESKTLQMAEWEKQIAELEQQLKEFNEERGTLI